MPDQADDIASGDSSPPSKSERKRRMHALQDLGSALLALNDQQLAAMPISDEKLLEAIQECRHIRSNSARKRHLQYIGKLMRGIDAQPIEAALQTLYQARSQATASFHELEQLRESLLSDDPGAIERVMEQFPQADRQHLRQLVRQHVREQKQDKPPAASRKLFRYLRELQENST